jgi:hypothetical protein
VKEGVGLWRRGRRQWTYEVGSETTGSDDSVVALLAVRQTEDNVGADVGVLSISSLSASSSGDYGKNEQRT